MTILLKVKAENYTTYDSCNHDKTGEKLCQNFIESRINTNIVNLLSLMKKTNIKTWKHMGQCHKRKNKDKYC